MVMNSDAWDQEVLVYSTWNLILSWSSGAANVSGRESDCDSLLYRNAGRLAGAQDRVLPSKQRSVTAVVTSRVPKPFICPCPRVISHMCPALAKSICCATHPYQPCQTRETSKGRNANAGLSASESPPPNPTIVPVTPSGTMAEHHHLTADMSVQ